MAIVTAVSVPEVPAAEATNLPPAPSPRPNGVTKVARNGRPFALLVETYTAAVLLP